MTLLSNKVLLITNIPTPYRIPLFNELKRQLLDEGLLLKVVFGAKGYDRRKWEVDMADCLFDYEVLLSKKIYAGDPEGTAFTYPGLFSLINRERPCVIITSGFSVASTKLWIMSWFRNPPYIIWSGSVHGKNEADSIFRRIQRTLLVKKAVGFIAYGTNAKEYLISLGARREKIEIGINTVDTEFFSTESARLRRNLKRDTGRKHLLYVGHLTKGKRLDSLFRAIEVLSRTRTDFVLDLVGEGPEDANLRILAEKLGIAEFVRFEGFRQKKEIPFYLSRSACFLFPSGYDVWGLVLVEAMAAGLPCVSSIGAGATRDLIEEGVTGFQVDFADACAVADRIALLLNDPELSAKMGENARDFISGNVSLLQSAQGFVTSVMKVVRA